MLVLELAFLIVAVILLLLAAASWVETGRWQLGWLGVACIALALLVPKLAPVV